MQISRAAGCLDLQDHCPNAQPEFIFSGNIYIVWSVDDQERRIGKRQPEWSLSQVKQSAFARSEIIFNGVLFKESDGLALTGCTFQSQIFNNRLAIPVRRQALFDCSFEFALRVKVKHIFDGGVIGGKMLHFEPSALIRRSAENSQVSVAQFQKRESTGVHQ